VREALFIKKNKDRWEKIQHNPSDDPDEMAQDFTELVNDLAYSKTFFPSSKVSTYINTQASRIYLSIYKNRREDNNRLVSFWKYELPLVLYRHRRTIFYCFLFFSLFFFIGYFLSSRDESVVRNILGDAYVDQTRDNIANGNPFGIYQHGNAFLSWIGIMIHNIRISLLMFVSGIFCGVPSLYMSAQNAVMVGSFDQFFAVHGLGLDFWLVVFVHGTLEITSLIIASAAGVILGKSFLFPGTIRRIDALKDGAKDGVKIMIGLMPVFGLAAFFEGFITRLYKDISWLTTSIFILSVFFVIWYFIIYPPGVQKKFALQASEEEL
jgi:uncharacterized membrane protein SpoIIM required for sporulation